ncbi:MAG TPA: hypothetical protein VFU21_17485, partial [Kofleriaceae bacterium]|nr:hypothetical protein [Kofleriaceae bacterium]
MLEDAADVVERGVGQARVAVTGEQGPLALPQRLVRVHPAAVVAEQRLRHEGDGLAVAQGDVLDDVLVPADLVGHLQEAVVLEVDLGLPGGRHLVVVGLHLDADLLHGQDHLGPEVGEGVGRRGGEVAALVARLVAEVGPAAV